MPRNAPAKARAFPMRPFPSMLRTAPALRSYSSSKHTTDCPFSAVVMQWQQDGMPCRFCCQDRRRSKISIRLFGLAVKSRRERQACLHYGEANKTPHPLRPRRIFYHPYPDKAGSRPACAVSEDIALNAHKLRRRAPASLSARCIAKGEGDERADSDACL